MGTAREVLTDPLLKIYKAGRALSQTRSDVKVSMEGDHKEAIELKGISAIKSLANTLSKRKVSKMERLSRKTKKRKINRNVAEKRAQRIKKIKARKDGTQFSSLGRSETNPSSSSRISTTSSSSVSNY